MPRQVDSRYLTHDCIHTLAPNTRLRLLSGVQVMTIDLALALSLTIGIYVASLSDMADVYQITGDTHIHIHTHTERERLTHTHSRTHTGTHSRR